MFNSRHVFSKSMLALVFLAAGHSLAVSRDAGKMPIVAGWIEKAKLPDEKLVFNAKLDTGADTSSLHAKNIKLFTRDGQRFVRFELFDDADQKMLLEKPVIRMTRITRRAGATAVIRRPVVKLKICLGGIVETTQFNLADRGSFKFKMLIGRSLLAGRIMVRSGAKSLVSDKCQ